MKRTGFQWFNADDKAAILAVVLFIVACIVIVGGIFGLLSAVLWLANLIGSPT